MRQRVLTATDALEKHGGVCPATGVMSGYLLRPFLDLTGDGGPINAQIVRYAGASLTSDVPAAIWVTPQSNTKAMLRRSLIRETALFEYGVTWPAQLPEPLVTQPWQDLCDEVAQSEDLDGSRRYRLVCILYKLGLFEAAIKIAGVPPPAHIEKDDFAGLTLLRAASAMSKAGRSTHSVVPHSVAVYEHARPRSRARLAATINLVIHYARATTDDAETLVWVGRLQAAMATLDPEHDGRDVLMRSIALRAASFGPFVRRDYPGLTAALDGAEREARRAASTPAIPPVLAAENLYAVLETRANAAGAMKDHDGALHYASALSEHDPLEPRAWLQLGGVHEAGGRTADALAAYRTAATLGAPFTAASWYCVGRCYEQLGELAEACHAYGRSVDSEPLGLTSLLGLRRVAMASNRRALADWAGDRLNLLHRRATHDPISPR